MVKYPLECAELYTNYKPTNGVSMHTHNNKKGVYLPKFKQKIEFSIMGYFIFFKNFKLYKVRETIEIYNYATKILYQDLSSDQRGPWSNSNPCAENEDRAANLIGQIARLPDDSKKDVSRTFLRNKIKRRKIYLESRNCKD